MDSTVGRWAIAVHAEVPVYRAGLESVLTRAGYVVEAPDDVWGWARSKASQPASMAVLLVALSRSAGMGLLERVSKYEGVTVLAVLQRYTAATYAEAIATGACGAVAWDTSKSLLLLAIEAARSGHALAPAAFVRDLSSRSTAWTASREQVRAIRLLASGCSVAAMADQLHYSEREMYRRLRVLYADLGVNDRHAAVLRGVELGLVADLAEPGVWTDSRPARS